MSDLKQRPSSTPQPPTTEPSTTTSAVPSAPKRPPPLRRSASFSQRAVSQTLASTAHLANLLPTGTLLAFQLTTPIFTNNGTCDAVTRTLTAILLLVLSLSCFLASFTDSFQGPDGQVYYGFATFKGMWLFDYAGSAGPGSLPDLSRFRLRFIDWVHAFLSVLVFLVVAVRDRNVVSCLYPRPSDEVEEFFRRSGTASGIRSRRPTRRRLINFAMRDISPDTYFPPIFPLKHAYSCVLIEEIESRLSRRKYFGERVITLKMASLIFLS
ncbi:hypothetical protein Nepgr_025769 [Nepenthes gracilis]|uniref:Uncharacterized protein n=1 Tax=Nepenthes gracilis TaxID=150966 RepID=A0AAD3Y1V3_NEPGR|nr:hypothetical protein Nepgr_025769 [Nepenthes gracilis]